VAPEVSAREAAAGARGRISTEPIEAGSPIARCACGHESHGRLDCTAHGCPCQVDHGL